MDVAQLAHLCLAMASRDDSYALVLERVGQLVEADRRPSVVHRCPAPATDGALSPSSVADNVCDDTTITDTRYGDASAWALSEGLVEEREGTLIVAGKSIRGGSLQQATDYLKGEMHGNVDFPGRNELRAILHWSYRRHKTPARLPFRVNKKQRAVAALVQKKTRRQMNAWVDSLSDDQIRHLWRVVHGEKA